MASLEELERAEDDVLALLAVATETAKELRALPSCDVEKLTQLSSEFVELGRSIQRRLVDTKPSATNTSSGRSNGSSSSSDIGDDSSSTQGNAADTIQADVETIEALQKLIAASSSSS